MAATTFTPIPRTPLCRICGLRIELTGRPGWMHLRTVAGLAADDDHLAELQVLVS